MKLKPNQKGNRRRRPGRGQTILNVLTGKWGKQHRLPAHVTGEADWEVEVPQIRMSRAFAVMLVLHIVAVGGLFAFRIWGHDAERKDAAAAEVIDPSTSLQGSTLVSTGATAPAEPPSEPLKTYVWHTGDTLGLVAGRFKITANALKDANPDKEFLPGTEIVVPRPPRIIGAGDIASTSGQPAPIYDPLAPVPPPEPKEEIASTPPPPAPRAEEVPENSSGATAPEPRGLDNPRQNPTSRNVSLVTPPKNTDKPKTADKNKTAEKSPEKPQNKSKLVEATPPKSKLKPAELPAAKSKPKNTDSDTPAVKSKPKNTDSDTPVRSGGQRSHVVTKGDTVYNIAKRYGLTAAEISKANGLGSDARIQLGQTLRIPRR